VFCSRCQVPEIFFEPTAGHCFCLIDRMYRALAVHLCLHCIVLCTYAKLWSVCMRRCARWLGCGSHAAHEVSFCSRFGCIKKSFRRCFHRYVGLCRRVRIMRSKRSKCMVSCAGLFWHPIASCGVIRGMREGGILSLHDAIGQIRSSSIFWK
jgi:hypothetical protein